MDKRRNKARLLAKAEEGPKWQDQPAIQLKDENNKNMAVDQEIECPRCHDIMTLCSDFDKLCYTCEECDFLLSIN
jgi:hypothetical protein